MPWRTCSSCCASAPAGLKAEAIDTVFACLDALSQTVEAIEADGQEALDPEPLVKRLRSPGQAPHPRAGARSRRSGQAT